MKYTIDHPKLDFNGKIIEYRKCNQCNDDVNFERWNFYEGLCSRCHSWMKHNQSVINQDKKSMEARSNLWNELCPSQYRDNPIDVIDKDCFEKVTKWKFGNMGLLCSGQSRRGKTTSCWHLLHRLYVLEGKRFEALSEPEFAQKCQEMARSRGVDNWLNHLSNVEILFIDDIGHAATSSGYLAQLYIVVENRTKWKKPIISTTQFSSEELISRSGTSGKTTQAILNRLKASSQIVVFGE
jgi:DNA replication protein DnaC